MNRVSHTVFSVAQTAANVGPVSPGDLKALLHIVAVHSRLQQHRRLLAPDLLFETG
jgi:hypothetical protein